MKIYVDLILLLNFFLDFVLLMGVNLSLRRNFSMPRIMLAAFIGSLSILLLFISLNSFSLFLIKIIISIIMVILAFNFRNIKYTFNNLLYLYLFSILLGGILYFVNDSLSYKNTGLIFFHNGFSINILLIIILTPLSVFLYIKNIKKQKDELSNYYDVTIIFLNGKVSRLTGFLDTGNNLYDPYKKRPIIMINKEILKGYRPKCLLVPCLTVNKESLIKCFKVKKIVINGKLIKDEILVGISDNNFKISGVDLLLHKKIIKENKK